ncbi:helix-turn-helix transcriptional regulator [Virgibacillus sp. W0430]|uniref:helix-turn-helix transcriptional regulator n=1 Tax=Virgibacillus sp. W0430 TaxID=3391580 RepID=UPI003F44EB4E
MKKAKPSSLEYHNIKGPKRTRLIQERKNKNLTQKELAKLLNTSKATVGFLENGRTKPSLELSLKIEQVFNQPFEILFPDL